MKRILLVIVILIFAGATVFAQTQREFQSSAQVTQSAQQLLSQGRTSLTEYESTLAQLIAANRGNADAESFYRIRAEMERIEKLIKQEEERITAATQGGSRVSIEIINRIERLIEQHKRNLADLEAFIARN